METIADLRPEELKLRLRRLQDNLAAARERLAAQEQQLRRLGAGVAEVRRYYSASPRPEPTFWKMPVFCAALAGLVLALVVAAPHRQTIARPALKMTHLPLPQATALDQQTLADEASNTDVLSLVYSFTPPGSRRTVEEMLGPNPHSSADDSPWIFVNVDARTTLVSLRPYGDDPDAEAAYEFVVDRFTRAVSASADTVLNLLTLTALPR